MADIKLGDIFLVNIPQNHTVGSEQFKKRPFVIMSRLSLNKGRLVVGVPLTSQLTKACAWRIQIPLTEIKPVIETNFAFKPSVALCDQVRALDMQRFSSPLIGSLTQSAILSVQLGLQYVFEMR